MIIKGENASKRCCDMDNHHVCMVKTLTSAVCSENPYHGVKNTGVDTSRLCRSKNATSQFNRSVSLKIAYGSRPPGYTQCAVGYVDRK